MEVQVYLVMLKMSWKLNFVNVQNSKINIETHRIIHNTSSIVDNRDEAKLFSRKK